MSPGGLSAVRRLVDLRPRLGSLGQYTLHERLEGAAQLPEVIQQLPVTGAKHQLQVRGLRLAIGDREHLDS